MKIKFNLAYAVEWLMTALCYGTIAVSVIYDWANIVWLIWFAGGWVWFHTVNYGVRRPYARYVCEFLFLERAGKADRRWNLYNPAVFVIVLAYCMLRGAIDGFSVFCGLFRVAKRRPATRTGGRKLAGSR